MWEYVILATMSDKSLVAVPTGLRACSNDDKELRFDTGSPDIDLSCQGALNASDCAVEGGECKFSVSGQYRVFYGIPGNTVSKVADTAITCNIASFGNDPAPGVQKRRWGYPL